MRIKNDITNSYYSEKEYKTLTSLGFKWSNKSNNSNLDNCLYYFDKFNKINIEIRQNGTFILETLTIFGKQRYEKTNDFLKIIKMLNHITTITIIQHLLLFLINVFYAIYIIFALPFYLLINIFSLRESIKDIKISFQKSYYDYKELYKPAAIFYLCVLVFLLGYFLG